MSEYTGSRCPVCKKKFTDEDDIVVCPTCGAPHHRDCYQELGECAFEAEHITGKAWSPSKPISTSSSQSPTRLTDGGQGEESAKGSVRTSSDTTRPPRPVPPTRQGSRPSGEGTQICNSCGTENPSTNLFCNLCGNWLGEGQSQGQTAINQAQSMSGGFGMPLSQQLEQQMQYDPRYALYGGLSPDERIGEHTVHDVATFVGKSSSHYMPRFKAISDQGSTISMNLSAFFFHAFYFLYRKMYAIGAILLVIFIISTVPTALYVKEVMLYDMHIVEVGADEQGRPVVPYDETAMGRLRQYETMSSQTRTVFFVISTITSLMANRLYYESSQRKITKTLKPFRGENSTSDKCIPCENALAKAGGTSIPVVAVTGVLLVLGYAAYIAYEMFLS